MRVFQFLDGVFDGIHPYIIVIAGLAFLMIDFLIALRAERGSVFTAFALLTSGLCFLPALLSSRFSETDAAVYALLLLMASAVCYVCLFAVLRVKEQRRARREERAKERRQAVFTLPDKENTFVRDRLNTSLRTDEEPEEAEGDYDLEESRLRLKHVREMLAKLKAASLSPSDRLETEGISRLVTLYATKNRLTTKEVRDLNDCLSAILKMTAKYSL